MAISALSAAQHLARKSGWTLTNLQMQKLIYLAHMYHVGVYGESLIEGSFEAWDYGPVHRDLYREVKIFGSSPVQDIFLNVPSVEADTSAEHALNDIFGEFGKLTGGQLVSLTHRKNGAWYKNYIPGEYGCLIPEADIAEEFKRWSVAA